MMGQKISSGNQIFILLLLIVGGLVFLGPLLYVIFLSITVAIPDDIEQLNSSAPLYSYASAFFGLFGMFLMAFLFFLRITKQKAKEIILSAKFQWKLLAISLATLVVLWSAVDLLYFINKAALDLIPNNGFQELEIELNERYKLLFSSENLGYYPLALFVFAVVPAIVEELVFRGLLLKKLKEVSGNAHFGVIVSSLMFAAFHLQPWNLLPMTALAMAFGYLYLYTKDIRYSIILHFLYNAIQMTLMFYFPS